jgi:nitrogen regulatory protein PII
MKMILVVCPAAHHEDFRGAIREHGIHSYTEMRHVRGEGETGKKFGSRLWPDESVLIFMVVEDSKKREIADLISRCRENLFPTEGMHAFVMPVEEIL